MQKQESLERYKDYCLSYSYSKMKILIDCTQWRNSWGGGREQSASLTLLTGKFLLTYQKKREARKNGKKRKKEGKIKENGKFEMEGEKLQNEKRTIFFFFFFLLFHFSKPLKFVLGLPKWELSTGKKHFSSRKKSGKTTLPPLKNTPLTPVIVHAQFLFTNLTSITVFSPLLTEN